MKSIVKSLVGLVPAAFVAVANADITGGQSSIYTESAINSSVLGISDRHHVQTDDFTTALLTDSHTYDNFFSGAEMKQTVSATAQYGTGSVHAGFQAGYSFDPGAPYGTISNFMGAISQARYGSIKVVGGTGTYSSNISFSLDGTLARAWSSLSGALDSAVGGQAYLIADVVVGDMGFKKDGTPVVLTSLADDTFVLEATDSGVSVTNLGFASAPTSWTGSTTLKTNDFSIDAGHSLGVYLSLQTGLLFFTSKSENPLGINVGDGYGTLNTSGDFTHTFSLAKSGPVFGGTLGASDFNFAGLGVYGNQYNPVPEPSPLFLALGGLLFLRRKK